MPIARDSGRSEPLIITRMMVPWLWTGETRSPYDQARQLCDGCPPRRMRTHEPAIAVVFRGTSRKLTRAPGRNPGTPLDDPGFLEKCVHRPHPFTWESIARLEYGRVCSLPRFSTANGSTSLINQGSFPLVLDLALSRRVLRSTLHVPGDYFRVLTRNHERS